MTTNFATLTGSEKQIAWATDLRNAMIEKANEYMGILKAEAAATSIKEKLKIDAWRGEQLEFAFDLITGARLYNEDDEITPESFAAALDTVLEAKDSKFYINHRDQINI